MYEKEPILELYSIRFDNGAYYRGASNNNVFTTRRRNDAKFTDNLDLIVDIAKELKINDKKCEIQRLELIEIGEITLEDGEFSEEPIMDLYLIRFDNGSYYKGKNSTNIFTSRKKCEAKIINNFNLVADIVKDLTIKGYKCKIAPLELNEIGEVIIGVR